MWNRILTPEDINNFMRLLGNFHDSCIKEIRCISGAYASENVSTQPINDKRSVDIIIQRQVKNPTTVVINFVGLKKLHLASADSSHSCEIFDAALFFDNGHIYRADNSSAENNIDEYDGTWLCAEEMQWQALN